MDPHAREAAAAEAAIADFYACTWRPQRGDIVTVEEPFTLNRIRATVQHAFGDVVLVLTEKGEQIEYDREEVERN